MAINTSNANPSDTTLTMEKMREVMEMAKKMKREMLQAIVLTEKYAPKEGVYQVPTDDGIYILSSKEMWNKIMLEVKKMSLLSSPAWDAPWMSNYLDTFGVPVIEDEVLAEKVMGGALHEWQQGEWMKKITDEIMEKTWNMDIFRVNSLFRKGMA